MKVARECVRWLWACAGRVELGRVRERFGTGGVVLVSVATNHSRADAEPQGGHATCDDSAEDVAGGEGFDGHEGPYESDGGGHEYEHGE